MLFTKYNAKRCFVGMKHGGPQNNPQYTEVPPNIEAIRLIASVSAVLSYSSNHMILKG
jgi:hypothetical protein